MIARIVRHQWRTRMLNPPMFCCGHLMIQHLIFAQCQFDAFLCYTRFTCSTILPEHRILLNFFYCIIDYFFVFAGQWGDGFIAFNSWPILWSALGETSQSLRITPGSGFPRKKISFLLGEGDEDFGMVWYSYSDILEETGWRMTHWVGHITPRVVNLVANPPSGMISQNI